jgi:hypothetical protein
MKPRVASQAHSAVPNSAARNRFGRREGSPQACRSEVEKHCHPRELELSVGASVKFGVNEDDATSDDAHAKPLVLSIARYVYLNNRPKL